ncbi:putative phage abortive infection protein [Chryseobacterium sediminis]|uniref:Phage abortive infection protein n=1 Tax=Chryseobacterium sediminis TaxID=1679494 RepID=A0A5B2U9U1_9FLAO|nr:putative phage abortive infection protein [Chryseobacterium sediminis]KAA2223098.1 hypothetical protein FW780_02505 [Chryseobacterium sediminis]
MKNNNWVLWLWLIGLGSIAFMSFTLWQNYLYATSLGKEYQGLFGDMFGASNALFTGLSFVGVIIAIRLQSQELKLQRKELELTRNEMELTRDEFVIQNSTMKLQQFENTFFQMLSLFHENTQQISSNNKAHPYSGKGIFKLLFDMVSLSLEKTLKDRFYREESCDIYDDFEYVREAKINEVSKWQYLKIFKLHFSIYEDDLNPYFTTLYNILKLIDKAEVVDKQYYVSIINSQFTRLEKLTVFYFTISNNIDNDFRKLVENFNLLDGIRESMVINKEIYEAYKPNLNNKLLLL